MNKKKSKTVAVGKGILQNKKFTLILTTMFILLYYYCVLNKKMVRTHLNRLYGCVMDLWCIQNLTQQHFSHLRALYLNEHCMNELNDLVKKYLVSSKTYRSHDNSLNNKQV